MNQNTEEPSISVHSPFYSTIAQLLQIRGRKIKPDQKACRAFMATLIRETAANYSRGRHTARDFFESLRARFAVLCVSKKHDDLLMWAHYAQNHSGCVMAFRCLPEKDRPLCAAQEVKYQSEFPSRASVHEYVKFLTGQVVLDYRKIFDIFALTKNNHWKYEEEWRCISLLSDRENGYDFDPIIPEELEAVYLGCRIADQTKREVMECLVSQFPNTHVYQASPDSLCYKLVFKQVR